MARWSRHRNGGAGGSAPGTWSYATAAADSSNGDGLPTALPRESAELWLQVGMYNDPSPSDPNGAQLGGNSSWWPQIAGIHVSEEWRLPTAEGGF